MKKIFTLSDKARLEYSASICRVGDILPIEGSDFIGKTVVFGENMIVRKSEYKSGDIVIYCPIETVINKKFLSSNNLFELSERHLNSNFEEIQKLLDDDKMEEAKSKVGFFNKFGRVKILKLRGVISLGFVFKPEELLKWKPNLDLSDIESYIGQQFDTIDDELFIKVYVPKLSPRAKEHKDRTKDGTKNERKRNRNLSKLNRMINGEFFFHYDTNKLNCNMWKINPIDKVTVSLKIHGCIERNTIINTKEYGDLTIGYIVDNKIECHIKAYDTILNEIVYVPIDNFYCVPNDGEWYEIELENGKKITITGNNPIWLPEENLYRRVDELNGNEFVLID